MQHAETPSRAWKRLSLARQLFLAMFSCVVAVATVYFSYDIWATNRRFGAMERSILQSVFPVVQRIVEHAMLHRSREQLKELFSEAAADGPAGRMYLLDSRKRPVDTRDFGRGTSPRRLTLPDLAAEGRLVMDFPLASRPACVQCHGADKPVIGYVRLVSDDPGRGRVIAANFTNHVLIISLMTLVLGLWALAVVRSMVERPLARVEAAMRQVRSGRFETRLGELPGGDFERIAAGFNDMVGDLERDRREILDLHRRQVAHMERLAAVGELSAGLAHEIRNPLTGISGAVQVLQADLPPDHARREVLGKILSQLSRMDQAMGNFLRFARMPEARVRRYELAEALQHTFFLIEPRLKAQGIELRREVAGDVPPLSGDPGQIEQVLLNLCLNAIQSMPSGGRLSVSARRRDGEVRLEIADEGCGIPAEQLDRVFQPFFTTRENGSGLGLPISRQIVLAHGGELWLESLPGRGTTAHVRLPVRAGAA